VTATRIPTDVDIERKILSLPKAVELAEGALLFADTEYREAKRKLARKEAETLAFRTHDGKPMIDGKSEKERDQQLEQFLASDRQYVEDKRHLRELAVIARDYARNELMAWTAVAKLRGGA
jgi:hypothetical protein